MSLTLVKLMPFKDRLRELRKAAGLTQMDLASAAGVTLSAITQMEAGKIGSPRFDTIKALARALGCTLDDLAQEGKTTKAKRKPKRGK